MMLWHFGSACFKAIQSYSYIYIYIEMFSVSFFPVVIVTVLYKTTWEIRVVTFVMINSSTQWQQKRQKLKSFVKTCYDRHVFVALDCADVPNKLAFNNAHFQWDYANYSDIMSKYLLHVSGNAGKYLIVIPVQYSLSYPGIKLVKLLFKVHHIAASPLGGSCASYFQLVDLSWWKVKPVHNITYLR